MNNDAKPFGGIPILLVGDLGQKGPVKGTLVTQLLLTRIKKIQSMKKIGSIHQKEWLAQQEFFCRIQALQMRKTQQLPNRGWM